MGSSGKQTKPWNQHEQRQFREDALQSYNAIDGGIAWRCIWGSWFSKAEITTAHLVPKALSEDEVSFLFGANQRIPPKNGLPLHKAIETALDTGRLVIVPIMPLGWIQPMANGIGCPDKRPFNGISNRRDLHNRELTLRSSFRPARRFLYFRFVVPYLHAKAAGNKGFTDSVESKTAFWASSGPCLHQSTMKSLSRNISGLELPPTITASAFEDPAIASRNGGSESPGGGRRKPQKQRLKFK